MLPQLRIFVINTTYFVPESMQHVIHIYNDPNSQPDDKAGILVTLSGH